MPRNTETITRDNGSHFVIEQTSDFGVPGEFDRVKVETRRVIPTGGAEQVQIELAIVRVKNGRYLGRYATLVLDPETATSLATNILTLRP